MIEIRMRFQERFSKTLFDSLEAIFPGILPEHVWSMDERFS